MALHKFVVTRSRSYPFLSLQKIYEGSGLTESITLTGDELEDYEQAVKNFVKWQERLADADTIPTAALVDIGAPAGWP